MNLPGDSHRTAEYLGLLTEVMGEFATAPDMAGVAVRLLRRVAEAMDAESAALFLLEGELTDPRARLVCQASVGPSEITGLALPAHAGIIGRALAQNATQLVADPAQDPDFVPPADRGYAVRSLLCAPLALRNQPIGAVEVVNRRGGAGRFDVRDAEMLEALASAAALAVSNAQLASRLVDEARMRRELELAAGVQRALLPRAAPGAAVHGLSRPARGVSGDFYDILPLPGGRTAFALADVSGKGMNAALIMVKAATLFRSFGKRLTAPGRLLARIERELCETMTHGMFVTMVVGVYDPRRHEVRFSNAGHEPPLWRDASGAFHAFPAADPPLGIQGRLQDNRYRETVLPLAGGCLYLFTDGLTEGRLPDGSVPGAAGVRSLIAEHADAPPAERLSAIAAQFGDELRDDLTLLVVDDGAQGAVERRRTRHRRAARRLVVQSIPAEAGQLKIVRRLVDAAARECGAGPEWAGDLVRAVDEAFQNIIRHAYAGCPDGRVELSIRRDGEALCVELVDFAPPVTEDECKGRALEDLRPGGLGTHFMHALTDSVRFMRPPPGAGNRLVLTKKLAKDPAT